MTDIQKKTTAGLEITCRSCGSGIPVQALQPAVTCPYCGAEQIVDAEMLRQLRDYQDRVKARLDKAHADKNQAEAMDWWYGKMRYGSGKTIVISILLFMGLPVGLSLLFMLIVNTGVLPRQATGFMPIIIVAAIVLSLAGYYTWFYSGRRKGTKGVSLSETRMVCPNCGARNVLAPGQVLERCAYCGAMLVPSAKVIQRSLEEVEQAARAAEMERYRKEREGIAKVMSYSAGSSLPYFIMVPFILILGVPGIVFTYEMAVGKEPYSPAIFLIWTIFGGLVAAVVIIAERRRSTRGRWKESLDDFARAFRGQVAGGTRGIVGWLNTFWAGPYDLVNIMAGMYGNGVAMSCQGYHALLFVDPVAASDQHRAKVHLFLAAWIPGVSDSPGGGAQVTPEAGALMNQLEASGFHVLVQQAGLMAEAAAHIVKKIRKRPEETASLVPVFGRLVQLASAIQARPVHPIP
jgi:predicted RNA-binding Zn-ribbon protein involved in translation (DUF1610 family)